MCPLVAFQVFLSLLATLSQVLPPDVALAVARAMSGF
jgi:hypothetical protein